MEKFQYRLVYGGTYRFLTSEAREILIIAESQLIQVFQDAESNQRVLTTFLSARRIKDIESSRLRRACTELSCATWAREFFHLLACRHDVVSALNQLVNLDDPNLKNYQMKIHLIFKNLKLPKTLEVEILPTGNTRDYLLNESTEPLIREPNGPNYHSNGSFPTLNNPDQSAWKSRSNSYRSYQAGISNAYVVLIVMVIGCLIMISLSVLLLHGYRIIKTDNTFINMPKQIGIQEEALKRKKYQIRQEKTNLQLNLGDNFNLNSSNRTAGSPTSTIMFTAAFTGQINNQTIDACKVKNQTHIPNKEVLTEDILTEHPIELDKQIDAMCRNQIDKNISLKVEFFNEYYELKVQCQFGIINLQVLQKPNIKNFYEILYRVSDLKHLELVYNKKDTTTSEKEIEEVNNAALRSLQSVSIHVTNSAYSCRELDKLLGDLSHVRLTKFEIIGMIIETQNKALIEKVIDNMKPLRIFLLNNVSLYGELSVKGNNKKYSQLHILNFVTGNISKTVFTLLKGASFIEDFSSNVPVSNVALTEFERLRVKTLNIVALVNPETETVTFDYLKKLVNLRTLRVHLDGWHSTNISAPYLLLEGFENLPNSLYDLQFYAKFSIIIDKPPQCRTYKKSAISSGMVVVNLRSCQSCIRGIGCLGN